MAMKIQASSTYGVRPSSFESQDPAVKARTDFVWRCHFQRRDTAPHCLRLGIDGGAEVRVCDCWRIEAHSRCTCSCGGTARTCGCTCPKCLGTGPRSKDVRAAWRRVKRESSKTRCPACRKRFLPIPKIGLRDRPQEAAHYRREVDERVRVFHLDGAQCVIERVEYDELVEKTRVEVKE